MRLPFTRRGGDPAPGGATAAHRNLLVGDDGTYAWYGMDGAPWYFTSATDRRNLFDAATARWAGLAGKRVHLIGSTHPFPHMAWAARRHDLTEGRRLPDKPGATSFTDTHVAAQERIADNGLRDQFTYLGVRLTSKRLHPGDLARVLDTEPANATVTSVRRALAKVTANVAREGFRARPLTPRGLAWLLTSQAALGVSVHPQFALSGQDTLTAEDLDMVHAPVRVTAVPGEDHVKIKANRAGRPITRYATVLTAGVLPPVDDEDPDLYPWMAEIANLNLDLTWSGIFDVVDGRRLRGRSEYRRRVAEDQLGHWRDHNESPKKAHADAAADAIRVENEVAGKPTEAVRLFGRIRLAVVADDPDDLELTVGSVIDHMDRRHDLPLIVTANQHGLVMEFRPGNGPATNGGYVRELPAYYMATAVPNAATRLGDGVGPYMGEVVSGGRGVVCLDPNYGPEHNESGLAAFIAEPRRGKSTLASDMAVNAVVDGKQVVINDPSGPMARLTDLPEVRGDAQHVELSGATPGRLIPSCLVLDPQRSMFASDDEHAVAVREAAAERVDLLIDTLMGLLPPELVAQNAALHGAVEAAARAAGDHYGANPWRALDALRADSEAGREAARALENAATLKGGVLVFPEDRAADTVTTSGLSDAALTVLTMKGLPAAPSSSVRSTWTRQQRMAVPILNLASRFAARAMYANTDPKVIFTDEGGIIGAAGESYKSFLLRGARDSGKHNTLFGILGQNPGDFLAIDPEIANLLGMICVGKLRDPKAARAALALMNLPVEAGFAATITSMPTGHWLMKDPLGQVGVWAHDLDWHSAEFKAATNTTPPGREGTDRDAHVEAA